MAEVVSPITRQVTKGDQDTRSPPVVVRLQDVEESLIYDRHGVSFPFKRLCQDRKSIIIFVRAQIHGALVVRASKGVSFEGKVSNRQSFLCYSCKEYVDDLGKIPIETLEDADIRLIVIGQCDYHHIEPFCALTGYPHEMYVDPQRCIYQKLGMKTEERFTDCGNVATVCEAE